MLETVISIPLIALVAGMLAYGLAMSLVIMHNNNVALSAGSATQKIMKVLESSKSCYDLETALADEDLFGVGSGKKFTISHNVTDCGVAESVIIHLEATRNSNSRVVFETTSKVFIQGSGYAGS